MRPTYVAMKYLRTAESSWNFAFHHCFHASHCFIGQWCVWGAGFCWIYSLLSQTLGACIQLSKKQQPFFSPRGNFWKLKSPGFSPSRIGFYSSLVAWRIWRYYECWGDGFSFDSRKCFIGVGWLVGRLEKLIRNPGWRLLWMERIVHNAMHDSEAGNFELCGSFFGIIENVI